MKPLIGITAASFVSEETGWPYERIYTPNAKAIERAGGLPVAIPASLATDTLRCLYERVDAILLPGGGDIDPVHYKADPHPKTDRLDHPRDITELTLARWSYEDNRPVFGICRGHQVLNVALGGTLIQDIPSQVETDLQHMLSRRLPRNREAHTVTIHPSSLLEHIIGSRETTVNSWHHQSVDQPSPSTQITALSPDGVIEALESPKKRFVLSVQWHPEDMIDDNPAMLRLFEAFVEAACERLAVP